MRSNFDRGVDDEHDEGGRQGGATVNRGEGEWRIVGE